MKALTSDAVVLESALWMASLKCRDLCHLDISSSSWEPLGTLDLWFNHGVAATLDMCRS